VSFSLKNRGEEGFASLKPEAAPPRIKLEEKRGTENIFGDETTLTADENTRAVCSLSLKK
jgi:hypothetical protein